MFNFNTFENGRDYFAGFVIRGKHDSKHIEEMTDLSGVFDDVKDIEKFCAAIVREFAIKNDMAVSEIKKDTIMSMDRGNDHSVVVSYTFETEKDSPLGSIYNTLEIYFAG